MAKFLDNTRYQKLSQIEHILTRPDTYIGSVEPITESMWVFEQDVKVDAMQVDDEEVEDDAMDVDEVGSEGAGGDGAGGEAKTKKAKKSQVAGKMVQRNVTFVPGLFKIFDEIMVNAADNKQRDPTMKKIEVKIHPEGPHPSISVYNNGRGIPVEKSDYDDLMIPELIFGHLLTSDNFNDKKKKTTGGRNGYGAKLTNIFSTEFTVETSDASGSGKRWVQTFSENMGKRTKPKILKAKGDFTRITFSPDMAKFGGKVGDGLSKDTVDLFRKRVIDLAGTTPGVSVSLNDQHVPFNSFQKYVNLYLSTAEGAGGAEGEVGTAVFEKCGERWQIAVAASEGAFRQVSFVNSINTTRGGTHVNHVADQVVAWFAKKLGKTTAIKPTQIKHQLWIFVNALIENPAFDSQTKDTLTTKPASFGSKCDISETFLKRVQKNTDVARLATAFVKSRETKQMAATDGKKKNRVTGIPKLEDANDAGTKSSGDCTLILTEGDSAKALAVAGMSVVGRDRYGVFPLRGKLINPREANHDQIMKNEEIRALKTILGLQQGVKYRDTKSLRYGHVMIMTDQDPDGSHIKGLIINFLHYYWPELLALPGFLIEFVTPIIKATKGGANGGEKTFFTLNEYEQWKDEGGKGSVVGWKIKYYKGLGTSTSAEAKQYFSDLPMHRLDFAWDKAHSCETADNIEMAFSKKRADDRKVWLNGRDPNSYVDHTEDSLDFRDFINKELIHFSNMDNHRSIPSMMDGLKPGQRKILFSCFKRKLTQEIKVAQLAGYVAEHSAYHHGEQSLVGTIIGMAQTFLGSNNVNLLVPAGQFGTRLQGGKDAASGRYIFTHLEAIARALFHQADMPLLKYLDDDGASIEPEFYVPVVPLALLNGAKGIGTGWSTEVPMFDPRVVVSNLRHMLHGDKIREAFVPWYRGFTGFIAPIDGKPGAFLASGKATLRDDEKVLDITELPPGVWTQNYKEWLEKQSDAEKPILSRYREHHTECRVHFEVTLTDHGRAKIAHDGINATFHLDASINTSNMHFFSPEGKITRYETPMQILETFYPIRLEMYQKRKTLLVKDLKDKLVVLEDRVRFIKEVVAGTIVVAKRKRAELVKELIEKKYRKQKPKGKKNAEDKKGDEGGGADEGDEEGHAKAKAESGSGYDHLLREPLWSLTAERVAELEALFKTTSQTLRATEAKSVETMWEEDLDQFSQLFDAMLEADATAERGGVGAMAKIKVTKRKKTKAPSGAGAGGGASDQKAKKAK